MDSCPRSRFRALVPGNWLTIPAYIAWRYQAMRLIVQRAFVSIPVGVKKTQVKTWVPFNVLL
jgi:hypothetical protein